MNKVIMIGFLIGSIHQGVLASASSTPSQDSSGPKFIFEYSDDCPALKHTSRSVAKAVEPGLAKDLVPFMVKTRSGDTWRVSRDPNEINMALENRGTFPRLERRAKSGDVCRYFYYYKVDIHGRAIPLVKVIQLQKMEPVKGK